MNFQIHTSTTAAWVSHNSILWVCKRKTTSAQSTHRNSIPPQMNATQMISKAASAAVAMLGNAGETGKSEEKHESVAMQKRSVLTLPTKQPNAAQTVAEQGSAPAAKEQKVVENTKETKLEKLLREQQEAAAKAAELQAQIDAIENEKRDGALASLKEAIAKYHFTPEELGFQLQALTRGRGRPAGQRNASKGTREPRYKDPATGTTWAGVGKRPRWLSAALEQGKKLEDFAL